jgi:hypothetical protein
MASVIVSRITFQARSPIYTLNIARMQAIFLHCAKVSQLK